MDFEWLWGGVGDNMFADEGFDCELGWGWVTEVKQRSLGGVWLC